MARQERPAPTGPFSALRPQVFIPSSIIILALIVFAVVFAGTAKGKTVYRVATGPVDKTQRPTVRGKLIDVGFDDVWALKLKAPKVVVELAALN